MQKKEPKYQVKLIQLLKESLLEAEILHTVKIIGVFDANVTF